MPYQDYLFSEKQNKIEAAQLSFKKGIKGVIWPHGVLSLRFFICEMKIMEPASQHG